MVTTIGVTSVIIAIVVVAIVIVPVATAAIDAAIIVAVIAIDAARRIVTVVPAIVVIIETAVIVVTVVVLHVIVAVAVTGPVRLGLRRQSGEAGGQGGHAHDDLVEHGELLKTHRSKRAGQQAGFSASRVIYQLLSLSGG